MKTIATNGEVTLSKIKYSDLYFISTDHDSMGLSAKALSSLRALLNACPEVI